jgi:alpha-1,3-rhamnosyl/mannosyltransferase
MAEAAADAGVDRQIVRSDSIEQFMRAGLFRRQVGRYAKEIRFSAGSSNYDLCHAVSTLPPGRTTKPLIPLIHDISVHRFPETHPLDRVRAFARWWPDVLACPIINTVSEFSREEIAEFFSYPRDRIIVTRPGIDPFFFDRDELYEAEALSGLGVDDRKVILSVGTQEPRKNIATVLEAFVALPQKVRSTALLIVVGGKGWGHMVLPTGAEQAVRRGEIRFAGYVSKLQLRSLYRRASLLVFSSIYEGFGIPVIEALACGAPVAISSGTALEEAAGAHGILVEAKNVAGWSAAMAKSLQAGSPTQHEIAKRQDWARQFSWVTNALRTLAMYRSVLYGEPLT